MARDEGMAPLAAGSEMKPLIASDSLEDRLARLQAQLDNTWKLEARVAQLEAEAKRPANDAWRSIGALAAPTAEVTKDVDSDSEALSQGSSSLAVEDLDDNDGEPPDSLFAYCVVSLAFGRRRAQWWSVVLLLMMVLVELTLAGGFIDCTRCRMIVNQWEPPQPFLSNACFYRGDFFTSDNVARADLYLRSLFSYRKVWRGQPFLDLAVGLICMGILALYVKDGNVRLLSLASSVQAVENRMGSGMRRFLFVVERLRTLVMPTFVLIGAAMQLSGCQDVIDLVLNAFAATFLLDMDRMLYAVALSAKEKYSYKKLWERGGMQASHHSDPWTPNYILIVDLLSLGSGFFLPRILDWSSGEEYQYELKSFVGNNCKYVGLARAFLLESSLAGGGLALRSCPRLFAWAFLDVLIVIVAYGMVNWPLFQSDTHLDYNLIQGCLNGTDLSACAC